MIEQSKVVSKVSNLVKKHTAGHWSSCSEPVPGSWAGLGKIKQLHGVEALQIYSLVSTTPSRHIRVFHHLCLFSQPLSPHPSRIPSAAPFELSTLHLPTPCNCFTRSLQESRSTIHFCSSPDKVICILVQHCLLPSASGALEVPPLHQPHRSGSSTTTPPPL